MPQIHDQRMELSVEKAVLLWCMRTWVAGQAKPIGAEHRIREMLARLGAAEAALYLEGLMFAIGHGAARAVGIQCVCRPSISADEHLFLDCIALAQASRPFEALLMLREVLSSEGARAALSSAEGIGAALLGAYRVLPAPEMEVRRAVFATG